MKNEIHYIASLLIKHLDGEINSYEQQKLDEWLALSVNHRNLLVMYKNKETLLREVMLYDSIDEKEGWKRLVTKIPALKAANTVI